MPCEIDNIPWDARTQAPRTALSVYIFHTTIPLFNLIAFYAKYGDR